MIFERKKYLDELIAGRGNGLVKIITGVRRCGKSFLLFDIWQHYGWTGVVGVGVAFTAASLLVNCFNSKTA